MKKPLALFLLLIFTSFMLPASARSMPMDRGYHSYGSRYYAPPPSHGMMMTPVSRTTMHYSPTHVSHNPPPPPKHHKSHHHSNTGAAVAGGILAGLVAGGIVAAILN